MTRSRDYYTPDEYVRNWLNSVAAEPEQQQQHRDDHATRQAQNPKRRRSNSFGRYYPETRPVEERQTDYHRQPPPQDDHEVQEAASRRDLPSISPIRTPHAIKEPAIDRHKSRSKAGIQEDIPAGEERPLAEALDDATRKYGRRPRHKTKADRYEYSDEPKTRKASNKRRGSHKKAGATLNQEFKAPNVESNRLTLKQGAMPGFFAKGKASEPTIGRGIPDLTFSEMTFLSKKRQLDDARYRSLWTVAAKTKSKNNDGAPDISDYFADRAENENNRHHDRGPSASSPDRAARYSSTDVQAVPRPSTRTTRCDRSRDGDNIQQSGSDLDIHPSKRTPDSTTHLGRPHIRMLLKSHSIPHSPGLSWPTSPERVPMHAVSEETANADLKNLTTGADQMEPQREALRTIHAQSSVSQTTPLRPEHSNTSSTRLGRRQQSEPSLVGRYYYTLEDLKTLAAGGYPAECSKTVTSEYVGEPHRMGLALGIHSDPRPPAATWTTTYRDRSKGRALARADPRLMPPCLAKFDETSMWYYAPRKKQHIALSWDGNQSQLDSRMEAGGGHAHAYGVPLDEPFAMPPDMAEADWQTVEEGGLDGLDTAILQATTVSPMASYESAENETTVDDIVMDQGTIQDLVAVSIHGGAQNRTRPQLLRPLQRETEKSPPFSGFKRPFLLY